MTTAMAEMTPSEMGDDARKWAEQFCATFPNCGLDWGTMVGWFANAIEISSDKRKQGTERGKEELINLLGRKTTFKDPA